MRTRTYIAGPISKGDLTHNIEQATAAYVRLMKEGYAPFCPHLTVYLGGPARAPQPEILPNGTKHEDWYDSDLPWVAVADAVLRLPGESVGADKEVALAKELGIPVYESIEELLARPPSTGDARFHALLRKMAMLHNRKSADYGTGKDFLANVRAAEAFGVSALLGTLIRSNDKMIRIQSFCQKGYLENESLEDSMMDLAAYMLIGTILLREGKEGAAAPV